MGSQSASGAALLGTSRINAPLDGSAGSWAGARLVRYRRRQVSSGWLIGDARERAGLPRDVGPERSEWVRPTRPARCRWRIAGLVGVHHAAGKPAHWSGLERCGSIWACPVCSAVIRAGRAREIQHAVDEHRKAGGGVLMVTLTLRHRLLDPLDVGLDASLKGWHVLTKGRQWRRIKADLGLVGTIRALEVTFGRNGWHPHAHALLLLEGEPTGGQVIELENDLAQLWPRIVTKLGARTPDRQHGVKVTSIGSAADYIAKVQEHDRAGLELARGDLKDGRRGSLMPFELLDGVANRALWLEYVEATHGRRAITWSRGLKARYGVEDLTDLDIIEDTEADELVMLLEAGVYDAIRNDPVALTGVLESAEGRVQGAGVVGGEARPGGYQDEAAATAEPPGEPARGQVVGPQVTHGLAAAAAPPVPGVALGVGELVGASAEPAHGRAP